MSTRQLNIDTDNLVKFTARLERLSKNDIPRVVKKTLDAAAMDVKQNTMPKQADKEFTKRNRNFFKANSRVKFADRSKRLESMESVVGFTENRLKGGDNFAVKDLEKQEYGGKISGRSFIPLDTARVSKSYSRSVSKKNRISNIDRLVNARQTQGKSEAQRFIKSVHKAGSGGHILSERGIVWRVNSVNRTKGGKLKLTPLYSYEKNRKVQVSGTGFMKKSSLKSAKKLDEIYIKEAKKQIDFRLSKT